jgi:uncharacterized protein YeaO (DUF488 family)
MFVNLSEAVTKSVTLVGVVPLGQTPNYLEPQSQEALHEVDVSGTAFYFSFDQHQTIKPSGPGSKELVRIGGWQNKEPAMIRIKRVYSEPSERDGIRILVDRVWPRGFSKQRARIDAWRKDLAPSAPLRKWFGHDPAKWIEFRKRYRIELRNSDQADTLKELARLSRHRTMTLVYGAADEEHNQAVLLKELLDKLRWLTISGRPMNHVLAEVAD